MNFRRLGAIIVKELRHLARDHLTFGMIIGIPIMELVLFGYAINMDVRNLDAAVLDQADTARSRDLIADMSSTQVINLRYHLATPQQIDTLLREGRISVALIVPPDSLPVRAVAAHPAEPSRIIASATNQLYHSDDDGATWSILASPPGAVITGLLFHPTDRSAMVAVTAAR